MANALMWQYEVKSRNFQGKQVSALLGYFGTMDDPENVMALKLVSNESDRQFHLLDELGRIWATPHTARSQQNFPGWSNKKTQPAELWAAIASNAEQVRVRFMIAAINACQGIPVEQLEALKGGKLSELLEEKRGEVAM